MQSSRCKAPYLLFVVAVIGMLTGAARLHAQSPDRPWMNPALPPEQRAELALKQMTLEEKLALTHGNGMAHVPEWQMPLTSLTNGGEGYIPGVERLGIPPLVITDAGYGVRDSGANGRYSTAMPSSLGAASSWDAETACEFGNAQAYHSFPQRFESHLRQSGADTSRRC